jgi:hypothetical protein
MLERGADRRLDDDPRGGDLVLPEGIAGRRNSADSRGARRDEERDGQGRAVDRRSNIDSG